LLTLALALLTLSLPLALLALALSLLALSLTLLALALSLLALSLTLLALALSLLALSLTLLALALSLSWRRLGLLGLHLFRRSRWLSIRGLTLLRLRLWRSWADVFGRLGGIVLVFLRLLVLGVFRLPLRRIVRLRPRIFPLDILRLLGLTRRLRILVARLRLTFRCLRLLSFDNGLARFRALLLVLLFAARLLSPGHIRILLVVSARTIRAGIRIIGL
jgi:hypothetical protein